MRPCWASSPPSGKARDCTLTLLGPGLSPQPQVSGCLHSRFKDNLVNTIGHRASERALQLGLLFPPTEALQVGMVDRVVPEDQVQSTALSVLAQWMAIPGEELREGCQLWVLVGEQSLFLLPSPPFCLP